MSRLIKRNDSKNFHVEVLTSNGPRRISTGTSDLEAAKRFVTKLGLFEKTKRKAGAKSHNPAGTTNAL